MFYLVVDVSASHWQSLGERLPPSGPDRQGLKTWQQVFLKKDLLGMKSDVSVTMMVLLA